MNSILLIALLSVWLCVLPSSSACKESCYKPLSKKDCPLFNPRSDMITVDDWRNMLEKPTTWINLYFYELKSSDTWGQCSYRYTPKPGTNNKLFKRAECYNLIEKKCISFDADVTLKEDRCGRAIFESVPGSIPNQVSKFHSQKPNQYMWHDIIHCRGERCETKFLELMVKSNRVNEKGVVDLTGLPLDLIAADLANLQNKKFWEKDIRFTPLDPGQACPLD